MHWSTFTFEVYAGVEAKSPWELMTDIFFFLRTQQLEILQLMKMNCDVIYRCIIKKLSMLFYFSSH